MQIRLAPRNMKRKATSGASSASKIRRLKEPEPDYCDAEPRKTEHGSIIWPAQPEAIKFARDFLRECAASQAKTLIVPDKDADGLSAGVILHRTLVALGLPPAFIEVYLIKKNATVHDESERTAMLAKDPRYIVVVDQGSRKAPPVVENAATQSLIIDHHLSDEFPEGSLVAPTQSSAGVQVDNRLGRFCLSFSTSGDFCFVDI